MFSIKMSEGRGTRVRGKGIIISSHFQFISEAYLIKPDICNSHPNSIESLLTINKDSLYVVFAPEKEEGF